MTRGGWWRRESLVEPVIDRGVSCPAEGLSPLTITKALFRLGGRSMIEPFSVPPEILPPFVQGDSILREAFRGWPGLGHSRF